VCAAVSAFGVRNVRDRMRHARTPLRIPDDRTNLDWKEAGAVQGSRSLAFPQLNEGP
jgi:hypothetical protein